MSGCLLMAVWLVAAAPIGDVDLLTVTDRGFAVSFVTAAQTLAEVEYGVEPGALDQVAGEAGAARRFHLVEVSGLAPGRKYFYRIRAEGAEWPSPPLPPKRVTTLVPPEGEPLFRFALMSDIHVGEDIAGLMVPPVTFLPAMTNGFTWRYPVDNYWAFSLRSVVAGANQGRAAFTVVNGDLTSWFAESEFVAAKALLDGLEAPYHVVRGNHDRVEKNPEDYFIKVFGLESSWRSFDHQGFHFILLDDNRLADGWHGMPEEEFEWLEQDLADHPDQPTFVFCHRPLGAGSVDMNKIVRRRLLNLIAANPQVVAGFNAHSHKARLTRLRLGGRIVPFIEVPSVKDYPVGYGLVEVFERGFMYNFHGAECADCREWREITRDEYFGAAPLQLLGDLGERNLVAPFTETVAGMVLEQK